MKQIDRCQSGGGWGRWDERSEEISHRAYINSPWTQKKMRWGPEGGGGLGGDEQREDGDGGNL